LGRADAALAVGAALWLFALAPARTPESRCHAEAAGAARCQRLASIEPAQLLFGGRLDLNRAAASSLEVLPGIGPARAAAIVAERCRAPFASVGDIERVSGIGPLIRARLAGRVAIRDTAVAGCEEAAVGAPRLSPVAPGASRPGVRTGAPADLH